MKPIKIMHVVRSLATGGMESGVRKLLSGLDANRFEQKVCTLIRCDDSPPANSICLDSAADRFDLLIPNLARVFLQERPDIVHSRNWAAIEAIAAAKFSGVPGIVHSEHGRDLQTLGRQPLRRRLARRISYHWADRIFCVSQELKQYYCRELGWGTTKFEVIPNGVDVEHFRPDTQAHAEIRTGLGIGPKTLVLGTVGRLDPVKDHSTLLQAAAMTLEKKIDLRLVIVGDGPNRGLLQNELDSHPELARRTLLTGDVSNVAHWLNSLDIFVLPSLSEGMSNTLLEAMSVGLPTIVTAVGGNTEVVEDGRSGLLVPPKDPARICQYLVQLSTEGEWRRLLGKNARQRAVAQYSLERMLGRYTELYGQSMKPNGTGVPALSRA